MENAQDASIGAPAIQEFNDLADEILHGHGTCNTLKRAKMTYCIAEAIKSVDQEMVQKSDKIGLIRDESKGRLAIRFRAVSRQLHVHSGTLGTARDFGSGAKAISAATTDAMNRFCSRFHGAPGRPKRTHFVKKPLLEKLRRNIVCITIDSAGDEVLASEMMRSSTLSNTAIRATPNLKFVIRDKAHGTKRLVSRGWGADPYLNKIMDMYCKSRQSIARTIQNSHIIRNKFKHYVQTSFRIVRHFVANMRSAKHRFESLQKPFGRTVLFAYPCIRTALWVTMTRNDASAIDSKEFLKYIDTENLCQAAMMADAADQTIALNRIMDDESVDPAIMNHEVKQYVRVLDLMYGNETRCLTTFGYTQAMLKTLHNPLVWSIDGTIYNVGCQGGVPNVIIDRCLDRMRCWLKLMKSTLAVEFPSFEIASACTLVFIK